MMKSRIWVIIRTYQSGWILEQTLKALFSQSFREFDLLIMDSGSSDETLEIAKRYPCQIIQGKKGGYFPGQVLNQAVQETDSEVVVFLNSDAVLLTPNCLEFLLNHFEDERIAGVFGRQIPRPDAETWVRRDYEASFPDSSLTPEWMHFSLPIAAIRRTIWEKHPFYTQAWGSEDTEWGFWAKNQGYEIRYDSEVIAMHSHNYSLRQLYGRRFIEGEADSFIFGKRYAFGSIIWDLLKAIVRDNIYYLKEKDFLHLWRIPFIRFVYFWAYYRGHTHGNDRQNRGDTDASKGQKTVLSRQEH